MEDLLAVVLNERPNCYRLNELKKELIIDETEFTEYEDNDFSGFYDWLRNTLGKVIGLRYTRLDGFEASQLNVLKKLSYVKFTHEKIIEIYFSSDKDYVSETSNDQDIGICKIYTSVNFTYAILLDVSYLSDTELSGIALS